MKSFSRTKQLLILHTLVLILVLGAYALFTSHINGKKTLAAVALSDIELLNKQNNQLQDLNSILKNINEDQEKLNSYFVHSDKIVNFLESVEAIGRKSGATVEVRSLNEEETEGSSISVLTLNLTAEGNWENIYHFLVLIQNFPIKSIFDKIHISSSETNRYDKDGNEIGTITAWNGVLNMKVLQLQQ